MNGRDFHLKVSSTGKCSRMQSRNDRLVEHWHTLDSAEDIGSVYRELVLWCPTPLRFGRLQFPHGSVVLDPHLEGK